MTTIVKGVKITLEIESIEVSDNDENLLTNMVKNIADQNEEILQSLNEKPSLL